jgi:uncharacterized protein
MKKLSFLLAILSSTYAFSQKVDDGHKHKVVIQFVTADSLSQYSLIGNIKNLKEAWPKAQIELVLHGSGILLALTDKTKYTTELKDYVENKGIKIVACQNTMKARKITKEMLLPFIETVPSGVAEVVLKQEKGWSYLKSGL